MDLCICYVLAVFVLNFAVIFDSITVTKVEIHNIIFPYHLLLMGDLADDTDEGVHFHLLLIWVGD